MKAFTWKPVDSTLRNLIPMAWVSLAEPDVKPKLEDQPFDFRCLLVWDHLFDLLHTEGDIGWTPVKGIAACKERIRNLAKSLRGTPINYLVLPYEDNINPYGFAIDKGKRNTDPAAMVSDLE